MKPIDIAAIEQEARELRAAELRRIEDIFASRLRLLAALASHTMMDAVEAVGELLRPLFSWNPQDADRARVKAVRPSVTVRANRIARSLFAWNPRDHRSC